MGDVDPTGQAYPALQLPLHDDVVSPGVSPYEPASHGPLQFALVSPMPLPYRPAEQLLQPSMPSRR